MTYQPLLDTKGGRGMETGNGNGNGDFLNAEDAKVLQSSQKKSKKNTKDTQKIQKNLNDRIGNSSEFF